MIDQKRKDDEIRSSFEELRAEDQARRPSLDAIVRRAPVHEDARFRYRRLAFGAIALFVIVGLAVLLRRPESAGPEVPINQSSSSGAEWSKPTISDWKAPTDVLLQTPGHEILSTVPSLQFTLGTNDSEVHPTKGESS